jgi:prepilin-type processing-associated H-X9-DG protein
MYAEDSNDVLTYASTSATVGMPPDNYPSNPDNYAWSGAHMDDSGANRANWDSAYDMQKRPLWKYAKSQSIFKCPSDTSTVNTAGGVKPRILTMAMNLYVGGFAPARGEPPCGTDGNWPWAAPFRIYCKMSSINIPSKIFVFLDMRQDRMNWSNFMTMMNGYPNDPGAFQLGDLPGMYHNVGCGFSFADGHSEMRRWRDARTTPPLGPVLWDAPPFSCAGNVDVAFLQDISTRPK